MKLLTTLAAALLASSALMTTPFAAEQDKPRSDLGPVEAVIGKLVVMTDNSQFPVSQEELDKAVDYLLKQAREKNQSLTRDEALVGIGFIAGSLNTFTKMSMQEPDPKVNPHQQSNTPAPTEQK